MADMAVSFRNVRWHPLRGCFTFGPMSIKAYHGQFIALVGPNGAGKSTLLNLLSGIVSPSAGHIMAFGKSLDDWSARERGCIMAFLSQNPERPFGFPVSEYIGLGRFPHLGPFRSPGKKDLDIIESEICSWGLENLKNRSVTGLSGGEFQRVRLARALVQEPAMLLLDEPGNHLDISSRTEILNRLKDEARSGRCVIAVLHDVNDALLYADYVWLITDGRLLETGLPQEVLRPHLIEKVYGVNMVHFTDADGQAMLGVPSLRRE